MCVLRGRGGGGWSLEDLVSAKFFSSEINNADFKHCGQSKTH